MVDRPEVEVTSVSKEEGYTFKATCIVKPDVEVTDYKGIKVTKTVNPVEDAEVDAEIARMQDRNARTITVEDRGAEKAILLSSILTVMWMTNRLTAVKQSITAWNSVPVSSSRALRIR